MTMTPTRALRSQRTSADYTLETQRRSDAGHFSGTTTRLWPVWARLVVIVGLSALLWAGIISGMMALFS